MNTDSKAYTPGAWSAGNEFKPTFPLQDVIAISALGEVIAHVNCGFGRGEANARLIEQAPALVAALRNALADLEQFGDRFNDTVEAARAALAKVECFDDEASRGSGPDRYPSIIRNRFGKIIDVG